MTERRLIIEQFDPRRPFTGGIDTCMRGLLKYRPDGVELSIVGVDACGDLPLRRWTRVDMDGVQVRFMPVARLYPGDQSRRVPHSVRVAQGVLRARSKLDAGVVQTHRLELGAVAQRLFPRTPHVQMLHIDGRDSFSTGSDSLWKHISWSYGRLERHVLPRASDVVVFSSAGAERLADIGPQVRLSPTWFDPDLFYPAQDGRKPDGRRVLWIGRIEPPKDPLLVPEVLARLPEDVTLTVIGDGTLRSALARRSRELGVDRRIGIAGSVSKREVAEHIRSHDTLLMTSHYEGFPRAVVESLACGLPVVATPGGEPNGLVIDNRTGYHATSRSAEELAARVLDTFSLDAGECAASVQHLSAAAVVSSVLSRPLRHAGTRLRGVPTEPEAAVPPTTTQ